MVAVAAREGTRLVRASPARSVLVAVTIGAATAVGVGAGAFVIGCGALSLAVVVVARRSPRPERLDSARAWTRAGASRTAVWLSGVIEALLLAWVPALVGGLIGVAWLAVRPGHTAFGDGPAFVLWQLGVLGLAAGLPTSRERGIRRSRTGRLVSRLGIALRVVVLGVALAFMYGTARGVRTDFDLAFAGAFILLLLALVGVIVTGPVLRWVVAGLTHVKPCRDVAVIAARFRPQGTVRLVIVAAVTVATAAAILGASVEARPDLQHAVEAELARVPVLPGNVALVRLDPTGIAGLDRNFVPSFTPAQLTALRAAVARAVPGAEIIELRGLGQASAGLLDCDPCLTGAHVVFVIADPRLRAIYHAAARYPIAGEVDGAPVRVADARTRVPTTSALRAAIRAGEPAPAESFAGAVYYEVPAKDARHITPAVSSVFVRSRRPLTDTELARLASVSGAVHPNQYTQIAVVGPSGQIAPPGASTPAVEVGSSLRIEPWAATSTASRWSVAAIAGLLALVTLLVTLAIDTVDRRRDVWRLERVGATPGQVRGSAALYAAALFVVVTWISALLVVWLVAAGTAAFNHAEPAIPVPFAMPWPVVLLLTVGLPAVAAGLTALVARPNWLDSRPG
jgi:hypothetical protein